MTEAKRRRGFPERSPEERKRLGKANAIKRWSKGRKAPVTLRKIGETTHEPGEL